MGIPDRHRDRSSRCCSRASWPSRRFGLSGPCDHRGRVRRDRARALTNHQDRRWEPKRLRLRLFSVPASLAFTGRRVLMHLAEKAPWAHLVTDALHRLRVLARPRLNLHAPVQHRPARPRSRGTRAHPRRHRMELSHPNASIRSESQSTATTMINKPPTKD